MSFVAVAVAAVGVGATAYSAVNASNVAGDQIKAQNLNSAAGRKAALQIADQQHSDIVRQLNQQIADDQATQQLTTKTEADHTKELYLALGLLGYLVIKKT